MGEIIDAVEAAFHEKGLGRVEMPPKPAVHPAAEAFAHAMPAWIPALRSVGVKWVSGSSGNPGRGVPYINGLIVLNDHVTVEPVAVMDCTWITAKRTGAATAVAAKYLAREDSRVLGVLGCGVQGRSNLEALRVLFPIREVKAYDTDRGAAERYAEEMAAKFGLEASPVERPLQAVKECDLVVTAGPILKVPHATIQPGWLEAGAFASAVDYDSYWHPEALREVDKFCTDDVPQLESTRRLGYFQNIPPVHAELAELVTGRKPGREHPAERAMACNLGLALDDMATAPLVYRLALEKGAGSWLPL
jgi:ornithine cyclodeaminase/alanine dehydrogenase